MMFPFVFAAGIATAQETPPAAAGKHAAEQNKQVLNAIYIPLADHYAAIVAFEKYRDEMKHAENRI